MRKIVYSLLVILIVFVVGCSKEEAKRLPAPEQLPNTEKAMNSPGFWISRHPFPDKVILGEAGIEKLNKKTETVLKTIKDIANMGSVYSGADLKSRLREEMKGMSDRRLYFADGKAVTGDFYRRMAKSIDFRSIKGDVAVRYGFVMRHASQRILPSDEIITGEKKDAEFDELQNSVLDAGTPLAVLHETTGGEWLYVDGPTSWGWVKKGSVIFCAPEELKALLNKTPFVVVTSPKADIFIDHGMGQFYDRVRMGTRFPLVDESDDAVTILMPFRDKTGAYSVNKAYMRKADLHKGYLQYSPRTIIEQAFKVLGMSYRWGCSPDESDCSGLVQETFATVGIVMPRNAHQQRFVGRLIGGFEKEGGREDKLRILEREAVGGITVIWVKGHIMIFLGMYNARPYIIHAAHAYKEKTSHGIVERVIGKVVVSDLSLGEGTPKGSLLDRLLSIRIVEN